MLAILFSLLVALFLLGPELLARAVLGRAVERKNLVQTRGEEFTRALVWAVFPWSLTALWLLLTPFLQHAGRPHDLAMVFSAAYSESFYRDHLQECLRSAQAALRMVLAVAAPLYAFDLSLASLLALGLSNYRWLNARRDARAIVWLLNQSMLSRVAPWHLMLSNMLLPSEQHQLHADVLVKSGALYRGRVTGKTLGNDGSLLTLTLGQPQRFRREAYDAAWEHRPVVKPRSDDFWQEISGNLFILLATDIANINLRYVDPMSAGVQGRKRIARDLLAQLQIAPGQKKKRHP